MDDRPYATVERYHLPGQRRLLQRERLERRLLSRDGRLRYHPRPERQPLIYATSRRLA